MKETIWWVVGIVVVGAVSWGAWILFQDPTVNTEDIPIEDLNSNSTSTEELPG